MFRKSYMIMRDFSRQMREKNISAFSASTAFFFFVSLVPMLLLVCMIIPYTPLTAENLVKAITDITPESIDGMVVGVVEDVYEKSVGMIWVVSIAMVWSAGKGVLALMRGLNAVNDVSEERNYFLVRMVASFYTVLMLIGMVLSLFIMVFGNVVIQVVLRYIPRLEMLLNLLSPFRFLVVWLVLTVLFTAVYAYVPNKKLAFREQIPGAVFSAVAWSFFSWGFSLYVDMPGSFGIYGSMSIIVIVMLWLYFCMYIVMIGAHLNRYFSPANRVLKLRGKKHK